MFVPWQFEPWRRPLSNSLHGLPLARMSLTLFDLSMGTRVTASERQTNLVMGILGEQSQVLMDVAKLLDVPRSVMILHIMIRWLVCFNVSLFRCFSMRRRIHGVCPTICQQKSRTLHRTIHATDKIGSSVSIISSISSRNRRGTRARARAHKAAARSPISPSEHPCHQYPRSSPCFKIS
jgi:hypothetical protein